MQVAALCRAATLFFALPSLALGAILPTAEVLREQVAPYLANPLPTVESIVGIPMPPAAPMLVVASFGDDGNMPAIDRGYAVGRTLNELLFGAHPDLDIEDPTLYSFDTSDAGVTIGFGRDSRANAYRIARREYAQYCVHGRVTGDRHARIGVVVDRCNGEADARRHEFSVSTEQDWPTVLAAICQFVIASTDVRDPGRSAAACSRARAYRAASIVEYGRFAASGNMTMAGLEAIVTGDPTFTPAVLDLIDRMPYDGDWRGFGERRKRLVAGAGATPAVVRASLSRHLSIYGWKLDATVYEPMYAFIRAHPRLRSGWLLLAARLAEGTPHDHRPAGASRDSYHPNESTHTAALALSLAYYATWPESYRARWQLGYSLMQYAWMLRGNATWDKVPRLGRIALRPLMQFADPLIAAALAAHPTSAVLWDNRIRTVYHTGGDWRAIFAGAVERLPGARNLYETGMEFSQLRWGGNPADIDRVESLARKNNARAEWVDTLRSRHRPKAE